MTDSHEPNKLLEIVETSIRKDDRLNNQFDGLAALAHACMMAAGFAFKGIGHESRQSPEDGETLPPGWNTSGDNTYAFRYTHSQSSLEFIIRVSRLGKKTVIYGIAQGDDKTCHFDLTTGDFTSENFYPWSAGAESESLEHGFISKSRIKDFVSLFKINVLQKLIPGLDKAGYQEEQTSSNHSNSASDQRPRPIHGGDRPDAVPRNYDPLSSERRPIPLPSDWPPDFEDELQMRQMYEQPLRNPFSIGADDLNPPGLGSMGGPFGGPAGPPRPFSGMYPSRNDPLFSGGGAYGDPTFPSPGMRPPGARWDDPTPGSLGPGRGNFGGRSGGAGGGLGRRGGGGVGGSGFGFM